MLKLMFRWCYVITYVHGRRNQELNASRIILAEILQLAQKNTAAVVHTGKDGPGTRHLSLHASAAEIPLLTWMCRNDVYLQTGCQYHNHQYRISRQTHLGDMQHVKVLMIRTWWLVAEVGVVEVSSTWRDREGERKLVSHLAIPWSYPLSRLFLPRIFGILDFLAFSAKSNISLRETTSFSSSSSSSLLIIFSRIAAPVSFRLLCFM